MLLSSKMASSASFDRATSSWRVSWKVAKAMAYSSDRDDPKIPLSSVYNKWQRREGRCSMLSMYLQYVILNAVLSTLNSHLTNLHLLQMSADADQLKKPEN